MTNNDITQKLALLPEGLAEENVRSWQHVVRFCELVLSRSINFQWQHLLEVIQKLSASEQIKLYRGGLSLYTLMISTKEKHGLEKEDAYIYVLIKDENSTEIGYYAANSDEAEKIDCNNDELITKLQPLLDRLWNEMRVKKNA